jgi:predicted lipid-binding transport protein (Tim44 family)
MAVPIREWSDYFDVATVERSFIQDANMLMMRPNYRSSDPGTLGPAFQQPPAKRQATADKGKAPAPNYPPPADEPSFPVSLKEVPFGNMTPVLRELALDTYIKETMGMANSLQQLEEQLQVAARHGDTGLQSTALLAAVSQLREDSLGLSRLRMQQYADLVQQSTSVVGKAIMKQKRRSAPGDVMP